MEYVPLIYYLEKVENLLKILPCLRYLSNGDIEDIPTYEFDY